MIEACKRYVKLELTRCQRNLDRGGSPSFWLWRLRPVLAGLDEMAAAVRQRIEKLERMDREQAASTFYVCNNCGETRPLPYYALVGCDVCWNKSRAGVTEPLEGS